MLLMSVRTLAAATLRAAGGDGLLRSVNITEVAKAGVQGHVSGAGADGAVVEEVSLIGNRAHSVSSGACRQRTDRSWRWQRWQPWCR